MSNQKQNDKQPVSSVGKRELEDTKSSHRTLMKISISLLVVVLFSTVLLIYLLFGTGFQDKLLALQSPDSSNNVAQVGDDENNDNNSNGNSSTDTTDKDEDDNNADNNNNNSNDDQDDNGQKDEDQSDLDVLISAMPDGVENKDDMVDYLDGLDDKEFKTFASEFTDEFESQNDANSNRNDDNNGGKSLADAYEEAEDKYPGQIDGSKRLSLVEDINPSDYSYYVIEQGDTLSDISSSFDVSLGQIVEINGIQDADMIYEGDILLLPEDTEQPDVNDNEDN